MSTAVKTSKYSYRSTGGGSADVNIEYSADLSALSRLEDKIRLLQDDLESERELRQRIEREKADLSVQVIAMSERLEEAEGGAENQVGGYNDFEMNRKRDVEMTKLRKLLEDVHLESEETAHILKKKHQEVMADFQEQLDMLTKTKVRAEKEKAKFQAEVYELLAQVESINKEKFLSIKQVEKLEVHVSELNVRIEELNRTILDITAHKTRLSSENIELVKEVQDLKVSIESVIYSKSQVVTQLEDARRRLEDEDRRRSTLEASLHQVEIELDSVRLQLEEESEARLDLERQLVKMTGEAQQWRAKYDAEAAARAEEIEELRRKYTARIQEQEEHIESLLVKLNNLEKQKSRLQSEVEVLIIDLEKSNATARELQKRVDTLERTTVELKSRLDETVSLYEAAQRELRNKQADIQRLNHELDKVKEHNNTLTRENKKLGDDLHDARGTIAEYTRRLHEMELELRRLENERDELTAAYKEAEAGRKAEEQRSQRLASEFNSFRHEAERRLAEKDEEIESIRRESAEPQSSPADESRSRVDKHRVNPLNVGQAVEAERIVRIIEEKTGIDRLIERNKRRRHEDNLKLLRKLNDIDLFAERFNLQETKKAVMGDYRQDVQMSKELKKAIRGKSANAISAALLAESTRNIEGHAAADHCLAEEGTFVRSGSMSRGRSESRYVRTMHVEFMDERAINQLEASVNNSLQEVKRELVNFNCKSSEIYHESSKQTAIEIEQLNARVVEAETKLKTEVQRIKKKLQITITELEMSLDVANKTNIDLQKTIKKQSLQLTELQAGYEEIQRQLQQTLDQYAVAQRRLTSLTGELDEVRANYEIALRGKRSAEVACEEAGVRITELTNINVSLASMKAKIEQELSVIASDYEEVTRELRVSDERYQKVQVELKHTVELLHEEQERVVKIEAIKKSLEVEIKNLSVRLEEVETNAIVGSKRIISKLEARIRDLELELEEEKRRHAETIKILRKKERTVKERQLNEQEGLSQQSVTRVRRFQRELEAAEDRADTAETNLNLIRAKHRTFVTTSSVPGSQVYLVQETRTTTTD
uniref:Putative myosin class ii heavy chain n=1 Tax=Lutzomyia longipalpis TaxID=7200 RepID=A0A1B0CJS7_LUTLO